MKLFYNSKILLSTLLSISLLTARAATNEPVAKTDSGTVVKPTKKEAEKKADPDTAWHPVRRVWGLAFGDFYYNAHSAAGTLGSETNYGGVPTYRNAFQFRRVYLGYDYDITKKFQAVLLLASEPSANTNPSGTTTIQNGDNTVDGKMSFYIKNIYLRWKDIFTGSDLLLGEQPTPTEAYIAEPTWGYRFEEKTLPDLHKLINTYDIGVGLQGNFDPATKNFGYDLMIGDNTQALLTSAATANTGFYKQFYGDIYAKFLDKRIIVDIYDDYVRTSAASATVGAESRSLLKGLLAYTTPKITFGVEAFSDKLANIVNVTPAGGTTSTSANTTALGISLYSHGAIYKDKLGFFARYDSYNPDHDFDNTAAYAVNANSVSYNPFTKEHFYNFGLDYTPTANVHFAPNVWLYTYEDQRTATTKGYLPNDHTLIYRLTFYFTFGK